MNSCQLRGCILKEETLNCGSDSSAIGLRLFDYGSNLRFSCGQKATLAVAITWVPLIVLGAVQGLAWGATRAQSVVLDPAMIARFLIAMPILILTASNCSSSIDAVVRHFLEVGIVQDADRQSFTDSV